MTGILGELGGGDQSNQVDHALKVGSAGLGEIPAQMLSAQADGSCQLLRRHRPSRVRDYYFPGTALERSGQPKSMRWLAEGVAEPRGKSVRGDQVARCVVVDAFDYEVDESQRGAPRCSRRIRRTERHDGKERRARKLGRERRSLPRVFTGRSEIDERGIYQLSSEYRFELLG